MSAPDLTLDALLALTAEVERLRAEVTGLRRQVTLATKNSHKRNLELDALHYVWCDGGCEDGAHRWQENPPTHEIVEAAIRNTERLVRWWNNHEGRAEGERVRAGQQISPTNWQQRERLKAERDALSAQCDSLLGDVVNNATLTAERDEARAQAARLAEALGAEIHCQTCDGTGIMGGRCEDCSYRGYRHNDCGCCGGAGKWEAQCAECNGTKQSNRSELSIAALASTDSRAWLREQIAEELERIDKELLDMCKDSLSKDYQHGMRVAAATCRGTAAELRRKEGE